MARSAEATAANRRATGRITDDALVVAEGSVAVLGEVEGPVEVEVLGVVTVQKGNTPVAKNGFPFLCVVEVDVATVVVTGALVVVGAIVVDAVEGVPLVVVTGALVVVGVAVVFVVTGALVVVGAVVVFVVTGALVVVGAAVVFVVAGALVVVAGATVVSDAGRISIGSCMQIASFLSFLFNLRLILPFNCICG